MTTSETYNFVSGPKTITHYEAYDILRKPENRHLFFGAEFLKKDQSVRKVNGRQGVTKHLKGGELKYTPSEHGYIIYCDRVKGDYRTLNTTTLVKLRVGKQDYIIVDGGVQLEYEGDRLDDDTYGLSAH